MEEHLLKLSEEQLTKALIKAIRDVQGSTDEQLAEKLSTSISSMHFHDGSQSPIAWNDVQAILYWNKYVLRNKGALLQVPTTASEGYNQHHHTSEYDGGKIAGIMGVHNHMNNAHGGFCFACFHPGTDISQAKWE